MKIQADTREELESAIDEHEKNGWVVVDRHMPLGGDSYRATLARKDEPKPPAKLYQCALCELTTIDREEICSDPHDLPSCEHATALMGIKEE